jgi:hypothetical protein
LACSGTFSEGAAGLGIAESLVVRTLGWFGPAFSKEDLIAS